MKSARLKGGKAAQKETRDAPVGTVIGQSPKAGTRLPRGKTVELVTAASPAEPETVTVPDVTGLDVRRAVAVLKDAGLSVGQRIEGVEATKAKPGTVLRQSLKPGSQVHANETISLVYAVAPRNEYVAGEIVLPDFTGSPIRRVEAFLRESGLVIGSVIVRDIPTVASPGYKFDFVGAQPGRWRVWAVDNEGREGEKSPWRTFTYTK